jgi:hypothetical protein
MKVRGRLNVTDCTQPPADPVEVAEFLLDRGEDRQRSEACRLVALLEGEVATHDALDEQPRAIDRRMPCDVRDIPVDRDELEVARWPHRLRQRQTELC